MFPAYKKSEEPNSQATEISLVTNNIETNAGSSEWLRNQSFANLKNETSIKQEIIINSSDESVQIIESIKTIEISSDNDSNIIEILTSDDEKKSKKKSKKKHKKKEKKHKKRKKEEDTVVIKQLHIETDLFGRDYKEFFESIPKEELKKAIFIEDIPSLTYKYAYRVDKRGDSNNLCFDTLYYKHVSNYRIPGESRDKSKKRKIIEREARQQRYFNQIRKMENDQTEPTEIMPQANNISKSLALFQNLFSHKTQEDTLDFNTYLKANSRDADKWLEFIEYQNKSEDGNQTQAALYERKFALFERAVKENPNNFRLQFEFLKFRPKYDDVCSNAVKSSIGDIEKEYQKLIDQKTTEFQIRQTKKLPILRNLILVWHEYIQYFLYKNHLTINTSRIKKMFKKSLEFFLLKLKIDDISLKAVLFNAILGFFLKDYLHFLQYCDYGEKSIGVYQALIDFNLCSKTKTNFLIQNEKDEMNLFELFYDSCLPKFGELYYIGYISELEKRHELYECLEKNVHVRENSDDVEDTILNRINKRIEHKWLDIEQLRNAYHWYPFYVQMYAGESIDDDCEDLDRLVNHDEDIADMLCININKIFQNDEKYVKYFKAKLLCQYFEHLNLFSALHNDGLNDFELENYLIQSQFDLISLSADTRFGNKYLDKLVKTKNYKILDSYINLARNSLKQVDEVYGMDGNFNILKWKFELDLIYYSFTCTRTGQDINDSILNDRKKLKTNLINEMKKDLSANRTNTNMWLQYLVTKYLIDKIECVKQTVDYKELRKITDNLLLLNSNNFIAKMTVCLVFIELILDTYHRTYDIIFNQDLQADIGISTQLYGDKSQTVNIETIPNKKNLMDLIIDTCVDTDKNVQANNTSKLNTSQATRTLLRRKELQNKYDSYVNELKSNVNNPSKINEIFLYHKLYTYYLALNQNTEALLEINQHLFNTLKDQTNSIDIFLEFYLNILYFVYFTCNYNNNKNEFKEKLLIVLNYLFQNEKSFKHNTIIHNAVQVILIKYKLNTKSIIDLNYIGILNRKYFNLTANKKFKFNFALHNLNADMSRLDEMNKVFVDNQTTVETLGLHNQLRNNFNFYLQNNQLSQAACLWELYFNFEINCLNLDRNRIEYLYYQSVKNVPFFKEIYLKTIEILPERFTEVVRLMDNKGIRVRLPLEELDMLLEPIDSKEELQVKDSLRFEEGEKFNQEQMTSQLIEN